jgi:hypothetical protein
VNIGGKIVFANEGALLSGVMSHFKIAPFIG